MQTPNIQNSILQPLISKEWKERNLQVFAKRDDLIHPDISGNKWRKLIYNIEKIQLLKKDTLITFGGAFSNHLVATAAACQLHNIQAIGIVRGDELNYKSNPTLERCHELGMKLIFVSRSDYSMRYDRNWWNELHIEFPNSYLVPEGGANDLGVAGCQDIWKELPRDTNRLFVAQGTTTTSCGLLLGAPETCKVHVVPVLKGYQSIDEMKKLLLSSGIDDETIEDLFQQIVVEDTYHFDGYGKYDFELLRFIQNVFQKHQLKLDPIYTGKSFYAMHQTIQKLDLHDEKIIFIHTGGLQGIEGFEKKEGIQLF